MKLSIIMPCYNTADTLPRALDSIAMQDEFGEFEVVVVDDCSEDDLDEVIGRYKSKLPIKYLKNQRNGGNAHSFYVGLTHAEGDYFCVLDGDDFYTVPDKLKKQVAFLDADTSHAYVAVATNFVVDFGDGTVHVPDVSPVREFTYADWLQGRFAYCHTATYMYRNLFRGMDPVFFDEALHRGDTPRTLFHLMYGEGKVRVLPFCGSAYSYTFKGIWSSADEREHYRYQVAFYTGLRDELDTDFERKCVDVVLERNRKRLATVSEDAKHHYEQITIDEAFRRITSFCTTLAFSKRDYTFRAAFYSEYVDSLAATLGYVARAHDPSLVQKERDPKSVAIVIGQLIPRGGGIFGEVDDLISIHSDCKVTIIKTEVGDYLEEARELLLQHPNVELAWCPKECAEPFAFYAKKMVEIKAGRIYYYCSHKDAIGCALMDRNATENVCLLSFDHGFLTGLSNPNLTWRGAKRPVDYRLLENAFGGPTRLVPAWSSAPDLPEEAEYVPFRGHEELVTACGAARYYKLKGNRPCPYFELVAKSLAQNGGKHYHFGQIPDGDLVELQVVLARHNVPMSRFVYIPWSENIPADLHTYGVDLFIEPFPTVSYKLTLDVMSAGVPVIAHRGLRRMEVCDFVPASTPMWSTLDEFLEVTASLDAQTLASLSNECAELYRERYSFEAVRTLVREDRMLEVGAIPPYCDDRLREIADYYPLYGLQRISLMNDKRFRPKPAKKDVEKPADQPTATEEDLVKKQAEVDRLRREVRRLRDEVKKVKGSKAFRVGTALATPLRKARDVFKRS